MAIVMSINFLPVRCNKGRSVASVHYVQSVTYNVVKQGLTSLIDVHTSPGGVMQVSITAVDEVSSFGPTTHQQPLQLPGRWKFNIVVWKIGRSDNDLPRPSAT